MAATPSGSRAAHARAILGAALHDRLPHTHVLLVGAGGIGCELLKNIVLAGFGHITLLDLDTIDLSNLNRQFLFRKKDVKQSKALVAARTASAFNPSVHITPVHANIKDPQFDLPWFKSFDIVLNALDNLDARRHVNRMCMAGAIPLVESGTAGYLGQVQPLLKDRTECFDCIPKPTPKTFPVCTIRSTPSQPIHCIVWAKSYLMGSLFGEDEDATGELDDAEKQGENAQEIATLRREASAFQSVRAALRSASIGSGKDAARIAFQKVFDADIRNLLSMEDMWRYRAKPVPLDFDALAAGTFVLRDDPAATTGNGNGNSNGNGQAKGAGGAGGLKDQRALSLRDNWELFVASTERLAARLRAGEETIAFDKDDDETLDFVTAAANLRSAAYGIAPQSRWEVKEMAGNIIPAIATTNAVVAGLIVLQALHLLRGAGGGHDALRNVHLQFKPAVPLSAVTLSSPSARCGVCRDAYAVVRCDPARATLRAVVDGVLGYGAMEDGAMEDGEARREVSTYEEKRLLSDPDFEDNLDRTLESLGVTRGKFLSVVDEDGARETVTLAIAALPPDHPADGPALILPSPLPNPAPKPKLPDVRASPSPPPARARAPSTPPPPRKRAAPDDADAEPGTGERAAKRARRADGGGHGLYTPSKQRRLEDDGLVILESGGGAPDDVIEID
ncbi:hypothetical protein HETIRDRAFT_482048 [Heterobasidion irregulare TC 32-1]|uniref:Ubiquitin-activating enzyme E1-like n=1 Tax=Heterobasidion irregulare (strain TC 32-1) TaxID=747525 RepID=W4JP70_HETIT|nr:uncharacterized protein HETIRDRAFT_482048 [Heterobasidion irregulare TC 32-1]ETW75323.1 hypothetical protein HETIRDRAFT_482048 [Heterobasidion irregulare TC 32-1]